MKVDILLIFHEVWVGVFCLWFLCIFPCEYYQRKYIFSLMGHTSFYVHYAFGNSSLHLHALSSMDLVIWAVLSLWVHCCVSSQALGFTGWDAAPSHWRSLSCGICLLCNVIEFGGLLKGFLFSERLWEVEVCLHYDWELFIWCFQNTIVSSLMLGIFYTWMRLCCTMSHHHVLSMVSQNQKSQHHFKQTVICGLFNSNGGIGKKIRGITFIH